jgi:hypothetical protein
METMRFLLRSLFLLLLVLAASAQAADTLTPTPKQNFTINGSPCVGCLLFTYTAGTTTPAATYTDSTGATPNTNPVVTDANGNANIWLPASSAFKYSLSPPTDLTNTNPYWTVDQITNGALGSLGIGSGLCSSGGNLIICPNGVTDAMLAATTGTGSVVLAASPIIASPTITGTLGGTGVVPNGALVNQGMTLGNTATVLGGTYTSLSNLTLANPTVTGTLTAPDTGSWTSSGITAAGIGVSESPSSGNVNISGEYKVAGAQISLSNLNNATTGSGAVVLGATPTISNPTISNPAITSLSSGLGSGLFICYNSGTGALTSDNTACNSSDARLKHNWKHDVPGLSLVMKLNPGSFDWLDVNDAKRGRQVGITAQTVEPYLPEIVSNDSGSRTIDLPDGKEETIPDVRGLDYARLTMPLIIAVQQQQYEIYGLCGLVIAGMAAAFFVGRRAA